MKTGWEVFKKELMDVFRDVRTLMTMLVMPLLLFPVLFAISSRMMQHRIEKAWSKVLRFGLIDYGQAASLNSLLRTQTDIRIVEGLDLESGKALVRSDSLDGLIVLSPDFDDRIARLDQGALTFYYKAEDGKKIEARRIREILDAFAEDLRRARFERLQIDPILFEVLTVEEKNLATVKERLAGMIGGMIPYIFVIFCCLGGMYPAIDLAAGEKERGTLETLLTTPADRFHLLLGKFGVVALLGLVSAVVSIVGLYLGVRAGTGLPAVFLEAVASFLRPGAMLWVVLLLVPLAVFFAGIELTLSMFSRSFKEAQSRLNTLMIVVIVPVFIGLLPGMRLDWIMAWIPILNISLATQAVLAGGVDPLLYGIVWVSSAALAMGSLVFCARFFDREEVLFRA